MSTETVCCQPRVQPSTLRAELARQVALTLIGHPVYRPQRFPGETYEEGLAREAFDLADAFISELNRRAAK